VNTSKTYQLQGDMFTFTLHYLLLSISLGLCVCWWLAFLKSLSLGQGNILEDEYLNAFRNDSH